MSLELKHNLENSFIGQTTGRYNHGAIFGGAILSQSIIAAYQTVSHNFHLHSFQVYFLKRGDYSIPLTYVVESIMDGKSFVKKHISVYQNDDTITKVHLSFKVDEPETPFRFIPSMPNVESPDKYQLITNLIEDKLKTLEFKPAIARLEKNLLWLSDFPFEIKPLDADVQIYALANNTNKLLKWIRLKDASLLDLEKKEAGHAILGFIADYYILLPVLTMHCNESVGFIVSLDHVMWFHNHNFDPRQWFLMETECNVASNGMSLNNGRIWSTDGLLLASFMQEGLIRTPRDK